MNTHARYLWDEWVYSSCYINDGLPLKRPKKLCVKIRHKRRKTKQHQHHCIPTPTSLGVLGWGLLSSDFCLRRKYRV